jgi:cobalamin biosynthesis protein CbiG
VKASGTVFVALLLVIGALGFGIRQQYQRAETAELQLGLDASRVLSAIFTQARDLRIAKLSGEVIAQSANDGTVFHTEQITKAPYRTSYYIDLKKVGQQDYRWNQDQQVMTVRIPDVTVEEPTIDMSRATIRQKGMWVSRKAGIELQRKASGYLATAASKKARSDENMAKARIAAKAAVTEMLRAPMAAAGYSNVRVKVHFPWESVPLSERWDVSRSPAEVLRDK